MEKPSRPRTALNECVKVVVRCRPISDKEKEEGHNEVVKVWSERGAVQVISPKGQDKLFTYDASYDCDAGQSQIYNEMVRPLVASVMDGFNGCVFAYGQTGTGKTFTMEGSPGNEGIIPRTFAHIWQHIENAASSDVTYLVSCSYVELYLEDIRDLLRKDNKKALTIRGQELSGFYIPDMTSIVCKSAADMMRVMRTGNKHRTAGRTDMNEHSSRSHAVFLVTVEMANNTTDKIRVGKLNLVDLAGSERQKKTNASADRLKEAARINQALSSLGNVISALAENSSHVPYRDSKLTRILQDSLGGNSKTIMIANIGPASYNYDETITTLRYAHRAKAIKNKPVRNEDPKDAKLREYQEEIQRLRKLIEERKNAERKKERAKKKEKSVESSKESSHHEDEQSDPSEHDLAATQVELERCRTSELEAAVMALEEQLVHGGAQLQKTSEELDSTNVEIALRKQREVEMIQKIELEEETTAIVTNTFTTLQQEVDHKTQRLKKCIARNAAIQEEMEEQKEAHHADRRELDNIQANLIASLRRRLLLADSFVPEAGRSLVFRVRYNEDTEKWELPPQSRHMEPIPSRPVASPRRRRPMCAEALSENTLRHRPVDVLDLIPISAPKTVRKYVPPAVPPTLKEVLNSALKEEAHIEIRKSTTAMRSRPSSAHRKVQVR